LRQDRHRVPPQTARSRLEHRRSRSVQNDNDDPPRG
jgi:hypothetical protein